MHNPVPSFFKAVILPQSSQRLLLSVDLVRHLRRALPEQALLRNHRGQIWTVKILKSRSEFYFSEGWEKFRLDNNITHNDIIVFDFDGYNIFDINLCGINKCDKEVGEAAVEEVENDDDVAVVVSDEYEESEESEEDESGDDYYKAAEDNEETESDEEENEREREREILRKGKQKLATMSSAGNRKVKELAMAGIQFRNKASSSAGLKKGKKRGPKTKKSARTEEESSDGTGDEDEVFKHGIVARPQGPYFVTRLRKRTNELYVPADVIRDYNLELGESIIILDERDREWKAKVKIWKDGRTWLCDGWRAYRKWNDLKREDRVLCEFKGERGLRGIYLKATLLRAGSWLPRVKWKT